MRHYLLAILFLFAVQPSPAALADSCGNMAGSHHGQAAVHHDSQHKSDCCDNESGNAPKKNCDPGSHCGACVAAAIFIPATAASIDWTGVARHPLADDSAPLTKFHSPPFRPPIS